MQIIDLVTPCPHCGRVNNAQTGVSTDGAPSDGDVSLCWGCRRPSAFVVGPLGTSLRPLTEQEEAEVLADSTIKRALAAMAESHTPLQARKLAAGE